MVATSTISTAHASSCNMIHHHYNIIRIRIITHFDINYYRKFLYGGSGDIVFNCNSMQVNFSFSEFKQMGGLGFPPSYICYDLFEEFDCYAKI